MLIPDWNAAFSIEAHEARTIKSAIDISVFIDSNTASTLLIPLVSFTSQEICGCNLILAPFAPPLLSVFLNVEAEAQAVVTKSAVLTSESSICFLILFISLFDKGFWLFAGIGSCQISISDGTSLPRYLDLGPISLWVSLNHARANTSEKYSKSLRNLIDILLYSGSNFNAKSAVVIIGAWNFSDRCASGTKLLADSSTGTHCVAPAGLFVCFQSYVNNNSR